MMLLVVLSFFSLLIIQERPCTAQVTIQPRPQPAALKADYMMSCCKLVGNHKSLMQCANASSYSNKDAVMQHMYGGGGMYQERFETTIFNRPIMTLIYPAIIRPLTVSWNCNICFFEYMGLFGLLVGCKRSLR